MIAVQYFACMIHHDLVLKVNKSDSSFAAVPKMRYECFCPRVNFVLSVTHKLTIREFSKRHVFLNHEVARRLLFSFLILQICQAC